MKNEYHNTLKHYSPELKAKIEADLDSNIALLNEYVYGPVNMIMGVVNSMN